MPLTSNASVYTSSANINGSLAVAGLASGLGGQTVATKVQSYGTSVANNAVGGADEDYLSLVTIAASGNTTINLQSFTDIAGQSGIVLVRLKAWRFHLLGLSDTAPDGTAGTACSSITIQGGTSNPFLFGMGGTTPTYALNNASVWHHQDSSAAGLTVSGSVCNFKIVNNDGANSAKILIAFTGGTT